MPCYELMKKNRERECSWNNLGPVNILFSIVSFFFQWYYQTNVFNVYWEIKVKLHCGAHNTLQGLYCIWIQINQFKHVVTLLSIKLPISALFDLDYLKIFLWKPVTSLLNIRCVTRKLVMLPYLKCSLHNLFLCKYYVNL